MQLSLGVRRSLQQCAQPDGTFAMLAMDQRGSLIQAMNSSRTNGSRVNGSNANGNSANGNSANGKDQAGVQYDEIIALKCDVIGALSPLASAVLLDVEYGYGACVASQSLSRQAGLLLALEKSGYDGDPFARRTLLLDNWSVERTAKAGANGVKLLVYYHPDAPNCAEQEAVVAEVAQQCHQWQLPLFLEPLHYSLDGKSKQVPNSERRRVVVESARRLVPLGVDILKAEFPLNVAESHDQAEWADACAELSEASAVPWVLLSAGVDFEAFMAQVAVACDAGASGVLCGRTIWKETTQLDQNSRRDFLQRTGRERFRQLASLVSERARPFTDFYPTTTGEELERWYCAQ